MVTDPAPVKGENKIALRFKDRDKFGSFCVELTQAKIPFAHVGFQTIVLPQNVDLEAMPENVRQKLHRLLTDEIVEQYPMTSHGKRKLISPDEAREFLRKATKRLQSAG